MVTERFDKTHQEQYPHSAPKEIKESVSIRLTAFGSVISLALTVGQGGETPSESVFVDERAAHFEGSGFVETAIVDRSSLLAGNRIEGPVVVSADCELDHEPTAALRAEG